MWEGEGVFVLLLPIGFSLMACTEQQFIAAIARGWEDGRGGYVDCFLELGGKYNLHTCIYVCRINFCCSSSVLHGSTQTTQDAHSNKPAGTKQVHPVVCVCSASSACVCVYVCTCKREKSIDTV